MTKKHFIALAARISRIADDKARWEAACAVADVCQEMCPAFNVGRFLAACHTLPKEG